MNKNPLATNLRRNITKMTNFRHILHERKVKYKLTKMKLKQLHITRSNLAESAMSLHKAVVGERSCVDCFMPSSLTRIIHTLHTLSEVTYRAC